MALAGAFGGVGMVAQSRKVYLGQLSAAVLSLSALATPSFAATTLSSKSSMQLKPPASRAQLEEESSVKRATDLWLSTVTSGSSEAAQATAALYAPDAILWGTLSEEVQT